MRKAREKVDSCPEPALNILLSHEFLKAKGGGGGGENLAMLFMHIPCTLFLVILAFFA